MYGFTGEEIQVLAWLLLLHTCNTNRSGERLMVENVINGEERRIFARVPISVEVVAKQGDLPVIKAKTLDISDGGIRLMSSKELPKGRVMELEMNLPMPLTIALGEVVWTRELETKEGKFFQAGIDFTRIG